MRDQFSSRDETLLKLYGHINKIMGQVTTLSRSVAQLEARLRKLEPRPPAEKPAVERRPKRVAM